MTDASDVLVTGTGLFAEKIVFALAAIATRPLAIAVGGRDAERMRWLSQSGNARATLFQRPVTVRPAPIRWDSAETVAETIAAVRPSVVAMTATVQTPRDFDSPANEWQRLVVRAGGFGVTAALQCLLLARIERAVRLAGRAGVIVNACYPDLVNPMMAARGTPIACGLGNIGSAGAFITAEFGYRRPGAVRVLAHHQSPSLWRRPPETRTGVPPRVWIGAEEQTDVMKRLAAIRMPKDPRQSIAGDSAAPLILGFVGHGDYQGHAPGPLGLPGGYPVVVRDRTIALDLPPGLSRAEAIAYNRQFADHEPSRLLDDGTMTYAETARREIAKMSAALAADYPVTAVEQVAAEWLAARERMSR